MKFIEIFAIWVMINRARLIICCEDVLWGCDILLWNFGNSESRLNDDTALVYITVKDFNISLREDLQWWRLLLQALRMWCPQLLIRSHAFPILDSRSFDCIAFSAQGFVVGLLFFFFFNIKLHEPFGFVIQGILLVSPHIPKRGGLAFFISWLLLPIIKRKQKMSARTNKRAMPGSFNQGPLKCQLSKLALSAETGLKIGSK